MIHNPLEQKGVCVVSIQVKTNTHFLNQGSKLNLKLTIYTLFHNSMYRFFYSVDGKSYNPRLIISYQPRCFYEFYCKGFHYTNKVLIAVWPLSGFSKKCVDEKTKVERSQSRTGNSTVCRILQASVI